MIYTELIDDFPKTRYTGHTAETMFGGGRIPCGHCELEINHLSEEEGLL